MGTEASVSDVVLAFATALLIVIAVLVVLTVAAVFVALAVRTLLRDRDERVRAQWRRPLALAAAGIPVPDPPRARRRDRVVALELWIRHRDAVSMSGELANFAERTGLRSHARRLARRRHGRAHMAGVVALGWLGGDEDVELLECIARRGREPMATAALASLVRLDEPAAFPLIRRRLRAGAQPLAPVVATALVQAPRQALARLMCSQATQHYAELPGLLRIIGLRRDSDGLAAVRAALTDPTTPMEALAGALYALTEIGEPSHVRLALSQLRHEHWAVRVRAIQAVARLGGRSYTELLVGLLDDDDSWVRRRVAEAVAGDDTAEIHLLDVSDRGRLALEEAFIAREVVA
jgi:HEAT repeats